MADSNLESFHDAALLLRRGVHIDCAINGSRNSPFEGSCETIDDQIVEVKKPKFNSTRFTRKEWNALPKRVLHRMIRYRVAGRESPLTVVTTLTDRQRFTAEQIV